MTGCMCVAPSADEAQAIADGAWGVGVGAGHEEEGHL